MPPRSPDAERLRHKVLISLNDEQHSALLKETKTRVARDSQEREGRGWQIDDRGAKQRA